MKEGETKCSLIPAKGEKKEGKEKKKKIPGEPRNSPPHLFPDEKKRETQMCNNNMGERKDEAEITHERGKKGRKDRGKKKGMTDRKRRGDL